MDDDVMNKVLADLTKNKSPTFAGAVQVGAGMAAFRMMLSACDAPDDQKVDLVKAFERLFAVTMATYCTSHDLVAKEVGDAISAYLTAGIELGRLMQEVGGHA